MEEHRRIDLIIPTYKPGTEFRETLRCLALQTVKPDHLYVVNTEEALWDPVFEQDYPGMTVTHIPKEQFDHGTTRYKAAARSDAEILIFMTQDAVPAGAEMIGNLIRPILEGKAAVSYARQKAAPDADPIEVITRELNYPAESKRKTRADLDTMGIKTFFCSNVCAAYDRGIYNKLGGFVHPLSFNEDMIFASKVIEAGYAVSYTADAEVIHSHNYSGKEQYQRNFLIGRTQAQFPEIFEKYPSEGAGTKLVKQTAKELIKRGKMPQVFRLVWISGCKYLGYRAGKKSVKKEYESNV